MESLKVSPIGVIHSPYSEPSQIHPLRSRFTRGTIEIFPEYAKGLKDIEGFSHIYVMWYFHLQVVYSFTRNVSSTACSSSAILLG